MRPIGKITLEVSFGYERNFRTELLDFEVVADKSSYHAIFGREAYVKFTARPCYVYLQLKMPGPNGVITVYGDRQMALECENLGSTIAEEACIASSLHGHRPEKNLRSSKRVALEVPRRRPAGCTHRMVNNYHQVARDSRVALVQKGDGRWRICVDPISINNQNQGGPVIVRPHNTDATQTTLQISAADFQKGLFLALTWEIHRSYYARPESPLATHIWTNEVFNPLHQGYYFAAECDEYQVCMACGEEKPALKGPAEYQVCMACGEEKPALKGPASSFSYLVKHRVIMK